MLAFGKKFPSASHDGVITQLSHDKTWFQGLALILFFGFSYRLKTTLPSTVSEFITSYYLLMGAVLSE